MLDGFLAIARGAIHEFEGTVNQFHGDGLLAVFGAPLAHEDHAPARLPGGAGAAGADA